MLSLEEERGGGRDVAGLGFLFVARPFFFVVGRDDGAGFGGFPGTDCAGFRGFPGTDGAGFGPLVRSLVGFIAGADPTRFVALVALALSVVIVVVVVVAVSSLSFADLRCWRSLAFADIRG